MHRDVFQSVLHLRSLSPFLQGLRVRSEISAQLVDKTHNRAVLFGEITDHVLVTIFLVNTDELAVLQILRDRVAVECQDEQSIKARYLPRIWIRSQETRSSDSVRQLRPFNWSWLDMVVLGLPVQIHHLGRVLNEIYDPKEVARSWEINGRHTGVSVQYPSLVSKCSSSGCSQLLPTVITSTSDGSLRRSRGPPIKRMRGAPESGSETIKEHWRFLGHLQLQISLVVKLSTVSGSWASLRSEWNAFDTFMHTFHKGVDHFPVSEARLVSYMSFFDNASTGVKYLQALQKASNVLGHEWIDTCQFKLIKAGLTKHQVKPTVSFIRGKAVSALAVECAKIGRTDLSRFVTVVYTFQLRVQSEGVPLEQSDGVTEPWHSQVMINDNGSVTIKLKKRKNKPLPSKVTRSCICSVWPDLAVCGVCALKTVLNSRFAPRGRLFPKVQTSDIQILKKISDRHELGHITWHGFRRGRTDDIVAGLDVRSNPAASIIEIAESLGHNLARASFFHYLHKDTADRRRSARRLCEDTDSE